MRDPPEVEGDPPVDELPALPPLELEPVEMVVVVVEAELAAAVVMSAVVEAGAGVGVEGVMAGLGVSAPPLCCC